MTSNRTKVECSDQPQVNLGAEDRLDGVGMLQSDGATRLAVALEAARSYILKYVHFRSSHEPVAVTLWIAHAWAIESAETSPFLWITSPTKQSGKSRLFEVIEQLVPRPWRVVGPSEAVTYRKIDQDRPTMLLDEVDTIFGNRQSRQHHEPLRAILNAGNRRGTSVPRMVGKGAEMEVRDFDVYCAKALAGIGPLPDTVADRSIPVRMQRRSRSEPVEPFRVRDAALLAEGVAKRLESALSPLDPRLKVSRPDMPNQLSDRAADGWEPLLAIADEASGEWPQLARGAAIALSGIREVDLEDGPTAVRLLADIREIFFRLDEDRISSARLVRELSNDVEKPWATFRNHSDPITAHGVSKHLNAYDIRPAGHRFGKQVERGYLRANFESAWDRYLPSWEGISERQHVNTDGQRDNDDESSPSRQVAVDVLTLEPTSTEAGQVVEDDPRPAWDGNQ